MLPPAIHFRSSPKFARQLEHEQPVSPSIDRAVHVAYLKIHQSSKEPVSKKKKQKGRA